MMTKSTTTNLTTALTTVLTLALSLAHAGSVLAQPGMRAGGADRWDPVRRFDAATPEIGEPMPDLTLYDRDGKELRLRELLTGHFTVLVLGCLT